MTNPTPACKHPEIFGNVCTFCRKDVIHTPNPPPSPRAWTSNEKELYMESVENYIDKLKFINKTARQDGYRQAIEDAAKVVHGEIEVYEDQAKRVNPTRLKKIQKRWFKLKEIENRILRLLTPKPH